MTPIELSRRAVQENPKVVVASFTGQADETNIRRLDTYFDETLATDQPRHLLLDLSGLTFASTVFYGSLQFWREEMVKRNGLLVLVGMPSQLASTMRIFGLDRRFSLCPTLDAALAMLPKGA